jgi:hypothetical protein
MAIVILLGIDGDSHPPINYTAHAPDRQRRHFPTAALSSSIYAGRVHEGFEVLYYTLGDRIWKDYGFLDRSALTFPFADQF